MASITEIRSRMRSVEQTLKITNAMYLISSAKVKKARKQLDTEQRSTWAFSPVTKKVESKKLYNRKRNGQFPVQRTGK